MMKKHETSDAAEPPRRGSGPAIPELNEAHVIGRLMNDPVMTVIKGGTRRSGFLLTVPTSYVNGEGVRVTDPSYMQVVGWRAIAEQCKDLRKGDTVQVDGPIKTWKSKDKKYHWHVEARLFQVLEKAAADTPAEREPETSAA